jgi:hypothetical protein
VPELPDYAVVAGINRLGASGFTPLKGAKRDASEFATWLTETLGLPPERVRNVSARREPGYTELLNGIAEVLNNQPDGGGRVGRRLYLFFAGHGVGPTAEECGLLPADWSENASALYIGGHRCAEFIRDTGLFEEIVLCMDCCRDYTQGLPEPYFTLPGSKDLKGSNKVKRFYAFATLAASKARERRFDKRIRGVFSRALMTGLRGDARDGDGRITGATLKAYLLEEVPNSAGNKNQIPEFPIDDDIVFVEGLPPQLVPITITDTKSATGKLQLVDGATLKPIKPEAKALPDGRMQYMLPAWRRIGVMRIVNGELTSEPPITVRHKATDVTI